LPPLEPLLPKPLLPDRLLLYTADGEGALARRCGSLLNLGFIRFARRNTFLVDPQGRIAKVYVGVNPARNAREVLADLKELNR
jgi:peroxiredoxin Q/BCP